MNWELIHKLLDKLDTAVNSNSFWIELGVPTGKFDLGEVLVQHLRTGNFHFELVKQDINRDWNDYSEMVFPKNYKHPVLIQRPGNTWNGNEEEAKTLTSDLFDMLSVADKNWKGFLLTPNFLNQVNDYYDSGYIQLGYFENCGRDMAIAFFVDEQLHLLLTNGYS